MELSSSSIKKLLKFSCILGNGNHKKLFIFQETETLKSFLYFRKLSFKPNFKNIKKSAPTLLPPSKKCSYISGNLTFLPPKHLIKLFLNSWPQKT